MAPFKGPQTLYVHFPFMQSPISIICTIGLKKSNRIQWKCILEERLRYQGFGFVLFGCNFVYGFLRDSWVWEFWKDGLPCGPSLCASSDHFQFWTDRCIGHTWKSSLLQLKHGKINLSEQIAKTELRPLVSLELPVETSRGRISLRRGILI